MGRPVTPRERELEYLLATRGHGADRLFSPSDPALDRLFAARDYHAMGAYQSPLDQGLEQFRTSYGAMCAFMFGAY